MSSSLTNQQREAVQTLRQVVGLSSDVEAARILQNHNWDLDDAVGTLLAAGSEHMPAPPNPPQQLLPPQNPRASASSFSSSSISSSSFSASSAASDSSSSASSSSPSSSRGGVLSSLGNLPGSWLVKNAFNFVSRQIFGSDEKSQHAKFLAEFEAKYPAHPNFVHGSYNDAVRAARTANKMLFVYLHAAHHEDAPIFERETLCTEQVRDFLAVNFVSWAGDVRHPDAFQLSNSLQADGFPFAAVLLPQGSQVVVVHRFSGLMTPDELVARLMSFLDAHSNIVQSQSRATVVQDEARMLREQQDREYQEALERDRLKRRQEEEKRKLEEQIRQEQLVASQLEEERKQAAQRAREQKLAAVPPEPPAGGADTVAVAVRLPDGTKIQRRFLASHLMQSVYDWVDTFELKVDDNPIHRYQLVMSYPKRVFADRKVDLKSAQLGRQCLLIVQEVSE